jgi:hypothetical protein
MATTDPFLKTRAFGAGFPRRAARVGVFGFAPRCARRGASGGGILNEKEAANGRQVALFAQRGSFIGLSVCYGGLFTNGTGMGSRAAL